MRIRFYKNDQAFELVFFMLSPLLALPVMINGVMKGKFNNLVLISLTMALMGFIFSPFADLYRHTQQYLHFIDHGNDGLFFPKGQLDFIMYSMSNIFAKHNIPFEYVRFIFVFISYQISFFLFKRLVALKGYAVDGIESRLLFWIFFLSVPFIWIVNGLRMATACYIAALGWYYFYNRRFILGIVLYLISLCLHFGVLMFIPLYLTEFLPNVKVSRKTIGLISIIILSLGGILLQVLPASFIDKLNMEKAVDYYMTNSQKNFTDTQSVNGFIAQWLERLMLVYIYLRILFAKPLSNNKDVIIVAVCFFAWLITYPFMILYQKLSLFIIPVILFLYLKNMNDIRVIKHIAFCCLISFLAYIYGYRRPLLETQFYKLMVSPIYVLANADTRASLERSHL